MAGDPIFILGTERSGSNLLRLILNSHPTVAIPHPPHLVRYFAPLEAAYAGDFDALVRDMLRVLDVHIYPWDIPVDAARILREAQPRDAFGVYVALQEQYREHAGRARWGCKSTFMIAEVPRILARFPDARLILLVRDPRDVAVSSRKSVFSTFHPYYTAQLWQEQQHVGIGLLDTLPPSTIHLVTYERLVAEPETVVREICAFLGEDFEPQMLRHFETEEAKTSASLAESWSRTGEPIRSDSVARFRKELTAEEVQAIESIAHVEMARLGYPTVNTTFPAPSPLAHARFWLSEKLHGLKVEARSLKKDKNVGRRWKRAWLLFRLRMSRGR